MSAPDIDAIRDRAAGRFNSGFNCAESVYMAGAELMGKSAAPSVMTGFGGGIARHDSVCGALVGGIAVIGLACGRTEGADRETKERAYEMAGRFFERFREELGSELCTRLCGYDFSTPEGVDGFVRNDVHSQICTQFVLKAVDLLAEVMGD